MSAATFRLPHGSKGLTQKGERKAMLWQNMGTLRGSRQPVGFASD